MRFNVSHDRSANNPANYDSYLEVAGGVAAKYWNTLDDWSIEMVLSLSPHTRHRDSTQTFPLAFLATDLSGIGFTRNMDDVSDPYYTCFLQFHDGVNAVTYQATSTTRLEPFT